MRFWSVFYSWKTSLVATDNVCNWVCILLSLVLWWGYPSFIHPSPSSSCGHFHKLLLLSSHVIIAKGGRGQGGNMAVVGRARCCCVRQGLMSFSPHCCLHCLHMAVVVCCRQCQRWQRVRVWHGSGWQWVFAWPLSCVVVNAKGGRGRGGDVAVVGSGQCCYVRQRSMSFSPWWVRMMWGIGHEGWWWWWGWWWEERVCVCIWLWVLVSKDWLRPVRLVFCQSLNFWNRERPKTRPRLWSLTVLGISNLGQSWSSPVSVFFQSWDWTSKHYSLGWVDVSPTGWNPLSSMLAYKDNSVNCCMLYSSTEKKKKKKKKQKLVYYKINPYN